MYIPRTHRPSQRSGRRRAAASAPTPPTPPMERSVTVLDTRGNWPGGEKGNEYIDQRAESPMWRLHLFNLKKLMCFCCPHFVGGADERQGEGGQSEVVGRLPARPGGRAHVDGGRAAAAHHRRVRQLPLRAVSSAAGRQEPRSEQMTEQWPSESAVLSWCHNQ